MCPSNLSRVTNNDKIHLLNFAAGLKSTDSWKKDAIIMGSKREEGVRTEKKKGEKSRIDSVTRYIM